MLEAALETVIGVALGAGTIAFARMTRSERWMYSSALMTLPLIYAAFAMYGGEGAATKLELLWGLPYLLGGVLLTLVRHSAVLVVVGGLWLAHGIYDWGHDHLFVNAGVPSWYPVFCAAVDVTVGLYLLSRFRLSRRSGELVR